TAPFFLGLARPVIEGTVRSTGENGHSTDGRPGAIEPDTRRLDHPSRRYFVHLQAPGWSVIGETAPWRPGVAAGHNERVAWQAEPVDADTQDVYVEKLNPDNPRQVEDRGRWVDIETHKDWIAVRGRKTAVDFERESTRHGVIVASDREHHRAFALRWAGSEPGGAAELAALGLDRAASAQAFRSALGRWRMPARRVSYVDVDGARGSAIAALVPVRRGWTGTMPVPAWTGDAEWAGWMPAPSSVGVPAAALPSARAANSLIEFARRHPDRADQLLQRLATASAPRQSLTAQRAAIVDVLADALRERTPPAGQLTLFAHPLAVTDAARRRFNVTARAPSAGAAAPVAMTLDPADWDRSIAMNAPGQSGSPDSPNFADLAKRWSEGKSFPLLFSERAVLASGAATLTLTPK
ncbi:MAG: penicillin acylase family protein, partial [Vicinamibacterales bacterium]